MRRCVLDADPWILRRSVAKYFAVNDIKDPSLERLLRSVLLFNSKRFTLKSNEKSMRSDPLPYGQRGRDRSQTLIYEVFKNIQHSFASI